MQCVTVKNIAVYINTLRIGYVVLLKLKKHWSGHQKTNKGTVDKKNIYFKSYFPCHLMSCYDDSDGDVMTRAMSLPHSREQHSVTFEI